MVLWLCEYIFMRVMECELGAAAFPSSFRRRSMLWGRSFCLLFASVHRECVNTTALVPLRIYEHRMRFGCEAGSRLGPISINECMQVYECACVCHTRGEERTLRVLWGTLWGTGSHGCSQDEFPRTQNMRPFQYVPLIRVSVDRGIHIFTLFCSSVAPTWCVRARKVLLLYRDQSVLMYSWVLLLLDFVRVLYHGCTRHRKSTGAYRANPQALPGYFWTLVPVRKSNTMGKPNCTPPINIPGTRSICEYTHASERV